MPHCAVILLRGCIQLGMMKELENRNILYPLEIMNISYHCLQDILHEDFECHVCFCQPQRWLSQCDDGIWRPCCGHPCARTWSPAIPLLPLPRGPANDQR